MSAGEGEAGVRADRSERRADSRRYAAGTRRALAAGPYQRPRSSALSFGLRWAREQYGKLCIHPGFSGIWTHSFHPGFEPPLSGPGPVTNRSRTRQVFDNDGHPRSPGTKPSLVDHPRHEVSDRPTLGQSVTSCSRLSVQGGTEVVSLACRALRWAPDRVRLIRK